MNNTFLDNFFDNNNNEKFNSFKKLYFFNLQKFFNDNYDKIEKFNDYQELILKNNKLMKSFLKLIEKYSTELDKKNIIIKDIQKKIDKSESTIILIEKDLNEKNKLIENLNYQLSNNIQNENFKKEYELNKKSELNKKLNFEKLENNKLSKAVKNINNNLTIMINKNNILNNKIENQKQEIENLKCQNKIYEDNNNILILKDKKNNKYLIISYIINICFFIYLIFLRFHFR